MTGLSSLRYPPPGETSAPTLWGTDWRRRWLREVGSVHQHHLTGQLVAFYSDARDPAARLALQAELEGQPDGIAQVLAAVAAENERYEASLRREA